MRIVWASPPAAAALLSLRDRAAQEREKMRVSALRAAIADAVSGRVTIPSVPPSPLYLNTCR